jgi:hypothetical protein
MTVRVRNLPSSSWPGLPRPSTSLLRESKERREWHAMAADEFIIVVVGITVK